MNKVSWIARIALVPALGLLSCTSLVSGGRDMVSKVVVVRPLEPNGDGVDAYVFFPGILWTEYHPRPEGVVPIVDPHDHTDVPLNWCTERFKDGTLRITWTGRRKGKEVPYLTAGGFQYAEVPREKIHVIVDRGKIGTPIKPTIVLMSGNTAYLPRQSRETPESSPKLFVN